LTEEEKKQKLAELREKMAQKKVQKAEEDAKENKANEALRRKAGKACAVSWCPFPVSYRIGHE
jgi:UBX domain-containing protein 1/4